MASKAAAAREKEQGQERPSAEQPDDTTSAEDEYTTDSDAEQGATEARGQLAYGNARTRLRWQDNTLHLDVRQYLQNRRKFELRAKGRLDTATGQRVHFIQLQRAMTRGIPSMARVMAAERGIQLEGEREIDPTALLPGGLGALLLKDWSLAPGVRFASAGRAASLALAGSTAAGGAAAAGSGGDVAVAAGAAGSEGASASSSGGSGLRYAVTLRKQPQVVLRRGVWDSWLEGKCDVELGGGGEGQRLGLRAGLKLKVLRLNVTDKQDMQLAVGCDYITQHHSSAVLLSSDLQQQLHDGGIDSGGSGLARGVLTPYVRLSENSWAVRLSKGCLAFTYDL